MSSSIKLKLEVKSTDEQVAKFISATNDVHITFAPDYYSNIEYTSIGAQMYSNIEATIGVLNSNQENQTIMTIGNSNIQLLKDTLVRGNLVVDGHIISLGIDVAVSQQDLFISADHTNNQVFYENVFSNVVLQKYDELENNMLSSTSNNITNFISNEYNTLYNEGCNLINGSLEFQDFFSTDNIYSSEKFDTRFATKTADNIANGSNNKFIVNDKFNQNQFIIQGDISAHNLYTSGNAFVSGAVSSYQYYADGSKLRNIFPGDGTTDSIIEGSNLFFKSSYVADITDASNLDTSNLASSIFGENLQSILLDKSLSLSNYSFDTSNNVLYELKNLYGNLSNMMDFHYDMIINDIEVANIQVLDCINSNDTLSSNHLLHNIDVIYSNITSISNIISNTILNETTDLLSYLRETSNLLYDNYSITSNTLINTVYSIFDEQQNTLSIQDMDTSNFALNVSNYIYSLFNFQFDTVLTNYIQSSSNHFIEDIQSHLHTHNNYVDSIANTLHQKIINAELSHSNTIDLFDSIYGYINTYDAISSNNINIMNSNIMSLLNDVYSNISIIIAETSNILYYTSNQNVLAIMNAKQHLTDYITSSSNELLSVLNDNNDLFINNTTEAYNNTIDNIASKINNLTTDDIPNGNIKTYYTENAFDQFFDKLNMNNFQQGNDNKFIVNNIYDGNLRVIGTVYTSNMVIDGTMSILNTNLYQTGSTIIISSNNTNLNIANIDTGKMLVCSNNNGAVFLVGNNGYVAINNPNPSYEFDVAGTIKSTIFTGNAQNILNMNVSDKSTDEIVQGSNLYFNSNAVIDLINASNLSNYILNIYNELSNSLDIINSQSNYLIYDSNYLYNIHSNNVNNISNLISITSNNIVNQINLDDPNLSNYVLNTSNLLIQFLDDSMVNFSNYLSISCNIISRQNVLNQIYYAGFNNISNFIVLSDINNSNYILRSCNFLVNYFSNLLEINQSNYAARTCNMLNDYYKVVNINLSNYLFNVSNVSVNTIFQSNIGISNYIRLTSNDLANYAKNSLATLSLVANTYTITDIYGGDRILHMNFSNIKMINNTDDNNFLLLNRTTITPVYPTITTNNISTINNFLSQYNHKYAIASSNNIYIYNNDDNDAKTILNMMNSSGFVIHFIFRANFVLNTPIYFIGNNNVSYLNIKLFCGNMQITLGLPNNNINVIVTTPIIPLTWYVVDIVALINNGNIMIRAYYNLIPQNVIINNSDPAIAQTSVYNNLLNYAGGNNINMIIGCSNLIDTYEENFQYIPGAVYTNTYYSSNSYVSSNLPPIMLSLAYNYASFSNLIFSSYNSCNYDYQFSSNIRAPHISNASFFDNTDNKSLLVHERDVSNLNFVLTELETNIKLAQGYYYFMLDLANEVTADLLIGKHTDSNLNNYFNVANYYNSNQLINNPSSLITHSSNQVMMYPLYIAEGYYRFYLRMFRTIANRNNIYFIPKLYYTNTWTGPSYNLNNSNIQLIYMAYSSLNTTIQSGRVALNQYFYVNTNNVGITSNLYYPSLTNMFYYNLFATGVDWFNRYQLNSTASYTYLMPQKINIMNYIHEVSGGANRHILYLNKTKGIVYCSGYNDYGQLGINNTTIPTSIQQVLGVGGTGYITGITQVSAGGNHSLFLHSTGIVYACGWNGNGQLGMNNTTQSQVLVQVLGINGDAVNKISMIKQVSAGNAHSLFLRSTDGAVFCCGDNTYGQLGMCDYTLNYIALQQIPLTGTQLIAKFVHTTVNSTYIVINNGNVYSCGFNGNGELGLNHQSTPVIALSPVVDIYGKLLLDDIKSVSSYNHTLFLTNRGTVYGCGKNDVGQLGFTSAPYVLKPRLLSTSNVSMITAGVDYSVFLRNDGSVYGCGNNLGGELGLNITNVSSYINYLTYEFATPNMLTYDSSPYKLTLINNGGVFSINDFINNSILLTSNTVASFVSENWSLHKDLTIACRFMTSNVTSGDKIFEFSSGANNIRVLNVTNNLSFQINSVERYQVASASINWNNWNYFMWNITNSGSTNGFVKFNANAAVNYTEVLPTSGIYTNNIGSLLNKGNIYISDFRIIVSPLTVGQQNELYVKALETSNYLKYSFGNKNNDSALYSAYRFENQDNLLIDSSVNNRTLVNSGGSYASKDGKNSLLLQAGTYANIQSQNWSNYSNSNLTFSGWFNTSNLADGDAIMDFRSPTVYSLISSPNATNTLISGNDYYMAFTDPNTTYTMTVQNETLCDVLAVGGGGSGGSNMNRYVSTASFSCGWNLYGQLGIGSTTDQSVLRQVKGVDGTGNITGITQVAGGSHSLFLHNTGIVYACGWNLYGQLGIGSTDQSVLRQVKGVDGTGNITGITQVASGYYHSLFLHNSGIVYACGNNNVGQLGINSTTNSSVLVQVRDTTGALGRNITGITQVAGGNQHSLFLHNTGIVYACGDNGKGQLGIGSTTQQQVLVQVNGSNTINSNITGIKQVAGGRTHSLFLHNTGIVYACGYNANGQLGINSTTDSWVLVQVLGASGSGNITGITQVAGGSHSLFLHNTGIVYACGENNVGQLGINSTTDSRVLEPVRDTTGTLGNNITGIKQVACSGCPHSLFLHNTGIVYGCGNNSFGLLGNGTSGNQYKTLVQVNGVNGGGYITEISHIHAAATASFFINSKFINLYAGAGGAGQVKYLTNKSTSGKTGGSLMISPGTYTIKVGAGGTYTSFGGNDGISTTIKDINNNIIISAGGGGAGGTDNNGNSALGGGGGGGATTSFTFTYGGISTGTGGIGGIGSNFNNITQSSLFGGGGGGGFAGFNGNNAIVTNGGNGGPGVNIDITGISVGYGGGGSACISNIVVSHGGGSILSSAVPNTGGGGGTGFDGASGIVVLRYNASQSKNISIFKRNTKISFEINNALVYQSPSINFNTWNYTAWNIASTSNAKSFVMLNDNTIYYDKVPLFNELYTNTIGSNTNIGDIYASDFCILTNPINEYFNMNSNIIFLSSSNILIPLSGYTNASYATYNFASTNAITNDSSGNNRTLVNSGGSYASKDGKNSLLLQAGTYANIPSQNWSNYSNLAFSGWFNTSNLADGDAIMDFRSPIVNTLITSPNATNTLISGNDYYMAFTDPNTTYTMTVQNETLCDVLAVGGGGSGGSNMNAMIIITYACGNNNVGQLGINSTTNSSVLVQVRDTTGALGRNITGITQVAGGNQHSLFLHNTGIVYACGRNNEGQLGIGSTTNSSVLVQVKGVDGTGNITGITQVACGGYQSFFIHNTGIVYACGYNGIGQLGMNTSGNQYNSLVQVLGVGGSGYITGITQVAGCDYHSLFLHNTGIVYACGYNALGQLGINSTTGSSILVPVRDTTGTLGINITGITQVASGYYHSLFLHNSGIVYACGYNLNGQLGINSSGDQYNSLVQVKGAGGDSVNKISGITQVACGGSHSLFLHNTGIVYACGDNGKGQLGIGSTTQQQVLVQVNGSNTINSNITGIKQVAGGRTHSLFLHNTGIVYACGYNANGQLGINSTTDSWVLVQVLGASGSGNITGITQVAGGSHSLFVYNNNINFYGGAGGAGQVKYLTNSSSSSKTGGSLMISPGTYTIKVGAGGTYTSFGGNDGISTTIKDINNNIIISAGGGGAGGTDNSGNSAFGGGGGGGATQNTTFTYGGISTGTGGIGGIGSNMNFVQTSFFGGGGGGGFAGFNGNNAILTNGGNGGPGVDIDITGISVGYGGGGSACISNIVVSHGGGSILSSAVPNTGGGGGTGFDGASGIVVLRYNASQSRNISIFKRNTKISFEINNTLIYQTFLSSNIWNYVAWTISDEALSSLIMFNNTFTFYDKSLYPIFNAEYENTLGSPANAGDVYLSDISIINKSIIDYFNTNSNIIQPSSNFQVPILPIGKMTNNSYISDVSFISSAKNGTVLIRKLPYIVSNYTFDISHSNINTFFAGNRYSSSNSLSLQDFKIYNTPTSIGAEFSLSNILYKGLDASNISTMNNIKGNKWQEDSGYATITNKYMYYDEGYVGIGNTIPTASLDVNTKILKSYDNTTINSIKTNNSIWTNLGIIASSDERIKTNIHDLDDNVALNKILKIEPKSYNYIDKNRKNRDVYGFIAQQVKEVLPDAVSQYTEAIPNIYQMATLKNNIIININTAKIELNSKLLLIDIQGNRYIETVINTKNGIEIANINNINQDTDIFVYGTIVDDFNVVNKSYIYTLNVCALQDIYRKHEELKKDLSSIISEYNNVIQLTKDANPSSLYETIELTELQDKYKYLKNQLDTFKFANDILVQNMKLYKELKEQKQGEIETIQQENIILTSNNQEIVNDNEELIKIISTLTQELFTYNTILQMNNIV
jgi:alpha-tubulin suppressor-like RCC1 family protein